MADETGPDITVNKGEESFLRLTNDHLELVMVLKANGEIEFGEDYDPDAAALRFWTQLGRITGEFWNRVRREAREEVIAELQEKGASTEFG